MKNYKSQPAKVKEAAVGGNWFESICRVFLNVITLTVTLVLTFYLATGFRSNKGLYDCEVNSDSQLPLISEESIEDSLNVSERWHIMYMVTLVKAAMSFL